MNIEKFTTKFQQALSEAQSLALGKDNQFIEPVHLLAALLNQQDGSIAPILTASGVNVALLRNELNAELNKCHKCQVMAETCKFLVNYSTY